MQKNEGIRALSLHKRGERSPTLVPNILFQPLIPATTVITLNTMPVATAAASMAKPFCNAGPVKRSVNRRVINIAMTAPAAKGSAIGQFMFPASIAENAPAADTNAMTAREVGTMAFM